MTVKDEADERDLMAKGEDVAPVKVENLNANAKTWIAVTGFICALVVGWSNLKADMASNQKDLIALRNSVNKIEENLKAFDRLANLQAEINDIKKNGSDALSGVKSELEALRTAFRVHIAKTTKEPDPIP